MSGLSGRPIFTVGGVRYDWEDVVLAGWLWGDWPRLEERVRAGLACAAWLDDLDDDDDELPAKGEVDAAAEEFRYARDLVSADDMERWLAQRGLTSDDWFDSIERGVLLRRWTSKLDAIVDEYEIEPADVEAAIAAEAICSGVAGELARRLAERVAIYARVVAEAGADHVSAEDVERVLAAAGPELVADGLPGSPPAACRRRLERLARLDVVWRRFAATQATPDAVQAWIAAHHLDWIRIQARVVAAADRDVADELALCVREDGGDLAVTAAEVGLSANDVGWYADEVPELLRERLVGARAGELIGPLPHEGAFLLIAVVDKTLPSADDAAVRARAECALLARTVDREVTNRVTWHLTP